MTTLRQRLTDPAVLVDIFLWSNLAFLALDVTLAHRMVGYRHWGTYVPIVFSCVAPLLLLAAWALGSRGGRGLAIAVGFGSIVVGVAGLIFHLDGFFTDPTLKHLVYAAPFAAPLAYAGLGLLLIMNRMVEKNTTEWAQWVTLLALGGFVGNFALALADHAQVGFLDWREWIAVFAAAIAVGFLLVSLSPAAPRRFYVITFGVMIGQALVGLLGFVLHLIAIIKMDSQIKDWLYQITFSAPLFAPLLFANLAILGSIGVLCMRHHAPDQAVA